MDLSERKRKVNVEELSEQEVGSLEKDLPKLIFEITDEAVRKANKILNIYGLEAIMQLEIKKK